MTADSRANGGKKRCHNYIVGRNIAFFSEFCAAQRACEQSDYRTHGVHTNRPPENLERRKQLTSPFKRQKNTVKRKVYTNPFYRKAYL